MGARLYHTVTVGKAKAAARSWVQHVGQHIPGFAGAYLAGSAPEQPDDAVLPPWSDVDIMVVLDTPTVPPKPGKFRYKGVLLEATYLAAEQLRAPDQVLGHYHLAAGLRAPSIVTDPTGHLTALQAAVARQFHHREWVVARCQHARANAQRFLASVRPTDSLHSQVTGWLFGAGVLCHLLLVAGLRNPTVRTRYVAARDVLTAYGHAGQYEHLLALLGCENLSPAQADSHLSAVALTFDAAAAVVRSPFPFASDISAAARPIAIDGSRHLIVRGDHREAVFWIVATFARCLSVLHQDAAPDASVVHEQGFRALLHDLGIMSPTDLPGRVRQVGAILPAVWDTATAIIEANPAISSDEGSPGS